MTAVQRVGEKSLLHTSGEIARSFTGLDDSHLDKDASMLPIYIGNDALNEAVAREVRSRDELNEISAISMAMGCPYLCGLGYSSSMAIELVTIKSKSETTHSA
ncbi:hypothetical protein NL676_022632 [Syzygium grande]|nr:hypothetical protein NL676_022632 [Syzygium grande]